MSETWLDDSVIGAEIWIFFSASRRTTTPAEVPKWNNLSPLSILCLWTTNRSVTGTADVVWQTIAIFTKRRLFPFHIWTEYYNVWFEDQISYNDCKSPRFILCQIIDSMTELFIEKVGEGIVTRDLGYFYFSWPVILYLIFENTKIES